MIPQMESIQFLQTTPEQLKKEIAAEVKQHLDTFLEHFKPERPKEYIPRVEAAKMLSVDPSTLHIWARRKILTPLQMGGRIYFLREEIEKRMNPVNN
jgi:hypothetical protein